MRVCHLDLCLRFLSLVYNISHQRFVWCSQDLQHLYWRRPAATQTRSHRTSLQLQQLVHVHRGASACRHSRMLQRAFRRAASAKNTNVVQNGNSVESTRNKPAGDNCSGRISAATVSQYLFERSVLSLGFAVPARTLDLQVLSF